MMRLTASRDINKLQNQEDLARNMSLDEEDEELLGVRK
jgi:hypothetical protein